MRRFQSQYVPAPREPFQCPSHVNLDLEIGCGVGMHPIAYAQAHADRHIIAVDRSKTRLAKMNASIGHLESPLPNLSVVCEDADRFLVHCVPAQSVSRLFLLYPNPYPKEGQANKRWHRMPLMAWMLSRLKPGGEITLATNMEFYAQEALTWMVHTWGVLIKYQQTFRTTMPFAPRTHFEQKYLERGETLWHIVFKK